MSPAGRLLFLQQALGNRENHGQVWSLAIPLMLSNLTIPLVALADTAVIGHLDQPRLLTGLAVGATQYSFLAGMLICLRMGTTGLVAQARGAGDGDRIRTLLVQALTLALLLGGICASLLPLLNTLTLEISQASPAIAEAVDSYLQVRLWGLPATLGSYALIGWYLGLQDTRQPLRMLLLTNLGNILLDLLLVQGFGLGIAGAAAASVAAEWLGLLLGLRAIPRTLHSYPGHLQSSRLQRVAAWWPLLQVNRDLLIRSLLLQGIFYLVTIRGTQLGASTAAANLLLLNGLQLIAFLLDGLAHAAESLCGHAIGARNTRTFATAVTVSSCWALLVSLACSAGFLLLGPAFIALQTDIQAVQEQAGHYLPYLIALPVIAVWSYMLDGIFVAATRALEMRNAMLLTCLISLPIAGLLQPQGNHGLWVAFLLFMALRGSLQMLIAWQITCCQGWIRAGETATSAAASTP